MRVGWCCVQSRYEVMSPQHIHNTDSYLQSISMSGQQQSFVPSIPRQSSSSIPKFSLASIFRSRKRPVRRALTELGRNDKKANSDLAEKLLTISAEQFKAKWNFDPIKMRPLNTSGDNKYEWQKINTSERDDMEDKRHRMDTLCSLVPGSRSQLLRSAVHSNNDIEESHRIPLDSSSLYNDESTSSSLQNEEYRLSSESSSDSIINIQTPQQETALSTYGVVTSTDDVTSLSSVNERLTDEESVKSPSTASVNQLLTPVVPVVTVLSVTARNNDNSGPKQTKITDFTTHRKRVRSESTPACNKEVLSEDGALTQSTVKRQRLQ